MSRHGTHGSHGNVVDPAHGPEGVSPGGSNVGQVSTAGADVDIFELTPRDWAVFRDVRLRALAEAPEAFGSRLSDWADAPEERWRARLEAVEVNLVARWGDEHVGMVSGAVDGDDAELTSMWVDPAFRGRGVAAKLSAAVVRWAHDAGRTTYLMVRSDNAGAIAAYERAGFVDAGVREGPGGRPEKLMVHRPAGTDT